MIGSSKNFNPSVNIERDLNKDFDYVVTPNSRQIYNQLVQNVDSGIHSFTIIGSYGTGKSSFLVALRKNLIGDIFYFEPHNGEFKNTNGFEFDYLVGKYGSLIDELCNHFDLEDGLSEKEVLKWIDKKHKKLKKEGKFWFLVIDEFGKHLEYAAKENPEKELYFIQLLSEYVNDNNKNIFFVTTLHQAFDSYAHGLDLQQRKEWDKVRGRLKELTFNEPVEQLLFIASEYLKDENADWKNLNLAELLKAIDLAKVFPLKNNLSLDLAKSLYPLDPLSGAILSLSLQKYGQNERSLFTFLQSDEFLGINNYDATINPFYNLHCVYDYLIHNHHSFLSSKYNPHYVQWNALKKSLERIESGFDEDINALKKIVKVIGLLNIFATEGSELDDRFLRSYAELAIGLENIDELISKLSKKQIIRFRTYKKQYVLFEGTDFDIEHELHQASSKIDSVKDVVTPLRSYFKFPFVPAKKAYYETGTPRFFEFILSEKPFAKAPEQPIDGIINLVFDTSFEKVKSVSEGVDLPILYGVFHNTDDIESQIFLIEKTKYVIKNVESDPIAERELKQLQNAQVEELKEMVLENVYESRGDINWVYAGREIDISDSRSLNNELSIITKETYSKTPIFSNELINKEKVSPAIYRPRKTLLQKLVEDVQEEGLGFDPETYPPEKTIYLSLLKQSGIHRKNGDHWELGAPEPGNGFDDLWKACEDFFESTKSGKRPLTDLISILKKPPIGLKNGLIELWIPIYLIIKDNDYALFQEEAYIPELSYDIINLVLRSSKLFEIKAYHISDVKKKIFSKYRAYHNQDEAADFSNVSFVETIRPFLLVYNGLNEYGRNTSKISQSAQKLRDAIKTATEPEKAFFEDFPLALGYTNLESLQSEKILKQYVHDLDKAIEEIKYSYDALIDRIENCLLETLEVETKSEFKDYQAIIKSRYDSIKAYKLTPYQKKLLDRLNSPLADREKWLSSIAFAILDKPLAKMVDDEEPLLLDKLSTRLKELDNLVELSSLDFDPEKQEAYRLKIQTLSRESTDINVIADKKKLQSASKRIEKIKELLTDDRETNQAVLLKILEELGNHE
ncbi:MAG: hypothetical protein WDZ80_07200 [Candidatus Paceibacterota bacterium]